VYHITKPQSPPNPTKKSQKKEYHTITRQTPQKMLEYPYKKIAINYEHLHKNIR
jgi:hypothetical protein